MIPNQTLMTPRCTRRVSKLPDQYTEETHIVTADDGKEDLLTIKATMDDLIRKSGKHL